MPVRQSCITDLNLAGCGIDIEGLKSISKAMCKNRSLSKLTLQGNKLGAMSGPLFAKMVTQNKSLVHLDLACTDFNSGAVCMFVSALFQVGTPNGPNRKLTTLILSENDICDVGAKAISALLQADNMRILHLDLQGNRLTSTGANYMGKGIRRNKFLLYLGLQWNQIDDVGAKQLGKAITRNTALKGLFMMGNNVTQEGARLILEGSLTFDDTPVSIDIDSLPIRPWGERTEANTELERTRVEAEIEAAEIAANEAEFAEQEVAFHSDMHRNEVGEEITKEEWDALEKGESNEHSNDFFVFDNNDRKIVIDACAIDEEAHKNEDPGIAGFYEGVSGGVEEEADEGQEEDEEDDTRINEMNISDIMHLFKINDGDDVND